MDIFCECIVIVGLIIIVGAAGSSDMNSISLTQAIMYAVLGMIITAIGMLGCKGKKER